MKPPFPWSVKGVDPEAREAAKLAARRAGLSLGQWLSHVIRRAATEQLRSGGTPLHEAGRPSPGDSFAPSDTPDTPGATAGSVHGASAGSAPGASSGSAAPPALTTAAILENVQRLSARLEESEQRTAAIVEPMLEELRSLATQVRDVKEHHDTATNPVERAIARLAERLDRIEEPQGRNRKERRGGFLSRLFSD